MVPPSEKSLDGYQSHAKPHLGTSHQTRWYEQQNTEQQYLLRHRNEFVVPHGKTVRRVQIRLRLGVGLHLLGVQVVLFHFQLSDFFFQLLNFSDDVVMAHCVVLYQTGGDLLALGNQTFQFLNVLYIKCF